MPHNGRSFRSRPPPKSESGSVDSTTSSTYASAPTSRQPSKQASLDVPHYPSGTGVIGTGSWMEVGGDQGLVDTSPGLTRSKTQKPCTVVVSPSVPIPSCSSGPTSSNSLTGPGPRAAPSKAQQASDNSHSQIQPSTSPNPNPKPFYTLSPDSYTIQCCPYPSVDSELAYICLMGRQWIRTWFRNPLGTASWLHLVLSRCGPWEEGNGRVSRLFGSIPLLRYGYPPLTIPVERRKEYFAAINECFNGDHRSFVLCILQGMKGTMDELEFVESSYQSSSASVSVSGTRSPQYSSGSEESSASGSGDDSSSDFEDASSDQDVDWVEGRDGDGSECKKAKQVQAPSRIRV
ncbi:hypothetical protein VKT23_011819 [Stygiomarasmius scandens]|uniref:Fido domain-containing protein n=1 Tax=Marasmiellus scandens TaxID=2682957 RepID=A0ABR1J844_9AGAR